MQSTESALEQFRAQWREEVENKSKKSKDREAQRAAQDARPPTSSQDNASVKRSPYVLVATTTLARQDEVPAWQDDDEPRSEDKESGLETAEEIERVPRYAAQPKTALDHYERAVERESAGNMGDSVQLYRQAYKLDDGVHEAYKKKHFPPSSFPPKPSTANPRSAPTTASSERPENPPTSSATTAPRTSTRITTDLVASFANLSITPADPPTSASPPLPCPLSTLPHEILSLILIHTVTLDPAILPQLALTCRSLAHQTSAHNAPLYRHILFSTPHGSAAQIYRYKCTILGAPLPDPYALHLTPPQNANAITDLTPSIYPTHRSQFRNRPRIRFGGAYISTVNYSRPGGHSLTVNADGSTSGSTVSKHTWSAASPVHIVTYYRYLRFYRDGTCVSLLTSAEPSEVILVLGRENASAAGEVSGGRGRAGKDSTVEGRGMGIMKEALLGRWRITGTASGVAPLIGAGVGVDDRSGGLGKRVGEYAKEPRLASPRAPSPAAAAQSRLANNKQEKNAPDDDPHLQNPVDNDSDPDPTEGEGTLHIETQGCVPRYLWKMQFGITSSRKDPPSSSKNADNGPIRNNKLIWKGFSSYNKLTDDWGEFGLKNDRPFVWSRVRRWDVGGA